MVGKLSGWDDTIVALATAPGIGAIAVIRVSGKNTFPIINSLFPSKNLEKLNSHTIHIGFLKEDEEILDEVVLSLFKNPTSYTGEDIIEISCHGSNFVQEKIIQSVIKKGARIAKAGEFTQRAFLNGKLDLVQAESVADLIASNTEASRNNALKNMRGGFSTILKNLREELIKFSALIELELDFSQEDVEFADRTQLEILLQKLQKTTHKLLDSFILGNVIKNGIQVAIIGKPNAGKSTLLNTFLNENRAIVSNIAGTTRDTIEEVLNIDGVLFRLIDTAGIREHSTDEIENIGVGKSYEKMNQADLVLYLFDSQELLENELLNIENEFILKNKKYILVENKTDKGTSKKYKTQQPIFKISAKNNFGIDELKKEMIAKCINDSYETESVVVSNTRHYDILRKLANSIKDVQEGMQQQLSGDLLALDVRTCLHFLGEITGEITNEDQLDFIFSKFCIGK